MFTLTIQTDGAAFAENDESAGAEVEVGRILMDIGRRIAEGTYGSASYAAVPVVDINGNTCGSWTLTDESEPVECPTCGALYGENEHAAEPCDSDS